MTDLSGLPDKISINLSDGSPARLLLMNRKHLTNKDNGTGGDLVCGGFE